VAETIEANRLFASRHDIPLHIGVTEAGPLIAGVVKNTAALVPLLTEGIGATVRVSLSDTMESEVIAAREILACAGLAEAAVTIVSCPRCGRAGFDTHDFVTRWAPRLYAPNKKMTVAVMGCVVNGPGEARHADLGITGAGEKVVLFSKGSILATVDHSQADAAFEEALKKLVE
jgi:(E)-4-hydroxy-3-methylbut-2-enyl-diphosphate synthase